MVSEKTDTHLRKSRQGVTAESNKLFLLSIPFIIFVILFCYVPLAGWTLAFFDYRPGLSLAQCDFTGFETFIKIWKNKFELFRVLRNTLVLSFMGILASPLPLIFAVMLNEMKLSSLKRLIQTTTTLPNFISWIVVFSLAFAMFSSDGMINSLLKVLGFEKKTNFLGNNDIAWIFQWALSTWKFLGWSAIIYLAAISSIDTMLYDAAKIDGANRFQVIMNVTVPGLHSTYFVLLLLAISNMLSNGFDQYFVFYNPVVADKIEVLDYYVFKIGVLTSDYPQSIALGMSKTLISILLLFTANSLSRRVRGESIV